MNKITKKQLNIFELKLTRHIKHDINYPETRALAKKPEVLKITLVAHAIFETFKIIFHIFANLGISILNYRIDRQEKAITLAAVKQKGMILKFANLKWKNDPEIVLAAIRQHGLAKQFASSQLLKDPSFQAKIQDVEIK